jgi:hypothetical protein
MRPKTFEMRFNRKALCGEAEGVKIDGKKTPLMDILDQDENISKYIFLKIISSKVFL